MTTLGCAQEYHAVIHRRGGITPAFEIQGIIQLVWTRRLDEPSDASVTVAKPAAGPDCCAKLGDVWPWAHELTIYRDGDLVWQGPVHDVTETHDELRIDAKDVVAWLDVRINRTGYDFTGPNSIDASALARYFIEQGFLPDDPNVLPYLTVYPAGINAERKALSNTVFYGDELREIARVGIDYTTVGRRIIVSGDLAEQVAPRATLSEADFVDSLEVSVPGALLATRWIATGQDGAFAAANGGTDPFYGLVERLTVIEGATTVATTAEYARVARGNAYPQPVLVRVPDGAALQYTAGISIEELVCGMRIDVGLGETFCRRVSQAMRLARLTVTWEATGEKVAVSLVPLGISDGDDTATAENVALAAGVVTDAGPAVVATD